MLFDIFPKAMEAAWVHVRKENKLILALDRMLVPSHVLYPCDQHLDMEPAMSKAPWKTERLVTFWMRAPNPTIFFIRNDLVTRSRDRLRRTQIKVG
jgi:hypothetical protein